MKRKNTWRIPLGFIAGFVFLWRAHPTWHSFLLGMVLMITGEVLRLISAGTLVKFEGVTRDGIYAYTRNPLYIGSFLIGLGACIIGRDPFFTTFFAVAYPIVYIRIIRREEAFLTNRYGDEYRSFLADVPRLVPRHFSLSVCLEHSAAFLAVKNRELKTVAGIFAVWTILLFKLFRGQP